MDTNENENTKVQTFWDAAKAFQRGKYIATQAYLKMQERSRIYSLTSHLKEQKGSSKESPKLAEEEKL